MAGSGPVKDYGISISIMKRKTLSLLPLFFLFLLSSPSHAASYPDSLKNILQKTSDPSTRLQTLFRLTNLYIYDIPDSAIKYAQQQILEARQFRNDSALALGLIQYGVIQKLSGNLAQAVYYGYESLGAAEKSGDPMPFATANYYLSTFYQEAGDYPNALLYCFKAKQILGSLIDTSFRNYVCPPHTQLSPLPQYRYLATLMVLADVYEKRNQPDSALYFGLQAYQLGNQHFPGYHFTNITHILGNIYAKKGDPATAFQYYYQSLQESESEDIFIDVMRNSTRMAELFIRQRQVDSSIFYARKSLAAQRYGYYPFARLDALNILAAAYQSKGSTDSSARYLEMASRAKDSLFDRQTIMQIQGMTFNKRLTEQELINRENVLQQRNRANVLLFSLAALLLLAFFLYRNNRQQKKAKEKIEQAYEQLKAAQAQLIQSEKMASLGELTAGIAHEIQNPLNFVNNFSEVNEELLAELKAALEKGQVDEAISLADELIANEAKINHHGKRADGIVKSMLQHSRTSSGKKEPTDINTLCSEYLRLAYHGARAKDKSFQVNCDTQFDPGIGKVAVVPQELGRVLLNLINNALYAAAEKQQALRGSAAAENYLPTVTVSTHKDGGRLIIAVRDNGSGIPDDLKAKIFQPFFTTKPTGQGTGLGLSISYDIVKAHGGELSVSSTAGQGSEFTINLPAD